MASWLSNASSGGRRKVAAITPASISTAKLDTQLAGSISLYPEPPACEVTIEDFERLAVERLKVLKALEEARSKNSKEPELRKLAADMARKHLKAATPDESARNDNVSHFILRLAYCRTEELRHWFLQQECDLFRFRFSELTAAAQVRFMGLNNLPYEQLERDEFGELQGLLEANATANFESGLAMEIRRGSDSGRMFFKVPFYEVPELVQHRKVVLRRGFAFVPASQLTAIVTGQFRAHLSKELAVLSRKYAQILGPDESARLLPIVETISTRYIGKNYNEERGPSDHVECKDVAVLAKKHFPLCMANMHDRLMEERHLRYSGRLQLGLFLKAVGLPLDEAIKFWRAAFAPRTPADAWEKQYAYNVRYNYGKEGKRKDFTPFSCVRIVGQSNPGVGEHHGCPYKTFDESNLRAALSKLRVGPSHVNEAVRKAAAGHYQIACGIAFEGSHGGCACEEGIQHPNQYYDESVKLEKEASDGTPKGKDGKENTPFTPVSSSATPKATPGAAAPSTGGSAVPLKRGVAGASPGTSAGSTPFVPPAKRQNPTIGSGDTPAPPKFA